MAIENRTKDTLPPSNPVRRWLNTALFELRSPLGRRVNLIGATLIVISVVVSMVDTLSGISPSSREALKLFEHAVTLVFMGEYLLRLWAAHRPWSYFLSFYGMVDLLTWLPLFLTGDSELAIRLLRIFRILKLLRYLRALQLFLMSLADVLDTVLVVVFSIIIVAIVGGNVIHHLEPETFGNAFKGAWWALVTMTTVGYGDLVPASLAGKMLASALMLSGIALFALLTGTVSVKVAHLLDHNRPCVRCHNRISQEHLYCPYCGEEQVDASQINCPHCHRQVDVDDKFCPSCGQFLVNDDAKR